MIFPIIAYGNPVLRQIAAPVQPGTENWDAFISDMWETMYASNGVGLAAPQINRSVRLFTVDTCQIFQGMEEEEKKRYSDAPGHKGVFINAQLVEVTGTPWAYNEGCLSIPKIREDILRPSTLVLEYQDEHWQLHRQSFSGLTARVILHEYDHLEGRLFIDHLSSLKKKLLKGKLADITKR